MPSINSHSKALNPVHDEDPQIEVDAGPVPGGSVGIGAPNRDKSRHTIATSLLILLAVLIVAHYVVVAVFLWNGKPEPKPLETAFNTALPVLAGLVGSAVAFFFKEKQ